MVTVVQRTSVLVRLLTDIGLTTKSLGKSLRPAIGLVGKYRLSNSFLLRVHGSVGRTDLPGGDHATLIRSIKEKLLPLGDEIGFICGHGPGGKFGEERRTNPYLT